ncbi:hypothetical protein [Streptomyces sp. NPDC049040]|uniref:hypothetical protein n=1 Tax=Streptomyces sp. NPDC049040 TaxID=3365593 RepID=UPI0037142D78
MGRAARRRRNLRIALCLPVVGAVLAVAAVAGTVRGQVAPGPGGTTGAAPPVAAAGPTATASLPDGLPPARVVAPGEPVDVGGGRRLRLTPAELCADRRDGAGWVCKDESNKDGNQPSGSVNVQSGGHPGGMGFVVVYRGAAAAARVAVVIGGRTWLAPVVTLAGRPGWAAGYVDVPLSAVQDDPFLRSASFRVWDVHGRLIGSLSQEDG